MKNRAKQKVEYGNTAIPLLNKKQGIQRYRWCFTLNNYTEDELLEMKNMVADNSGIIGLEVGENGTPHIQGYIKFKDKIRLTQCKKINARCHWEATKGSVEDNFNYCSKESIFYQNIFDEFFPEHEIFKKLLKILDGPPDRRHIHVVVDEQGNMGKTSFAKWLFRFRKGTYYLSGKSNDMKYAIASLRGKMGDPRIILIDCPRSSQGYLSYQGIEEIKNGIFFSGKYESNMLTFDTPHTVLLTNFMPDLDKLSKDRWVIWNRAEGAPCEEPLDLNGEFAEYDTAYML